MQNCLPQAKNYCCKILFDFFSVKKFAPHFFIFSFLLFSFSCFFSNKIKQQNLSKIYKRNISSLNPEFVVYHENDSFSRVYFSIKTKEMLYSKKENEENFMAKMTIQYKLLDSYESSVIIDSSTSFITDICKVKDCSSQLKTEIIGDFSIRAASPKQYLLEITTTDIYRNQFHIAYVNVDKTNFFTRQNFLLKSTTTNLPLFKTHFNLNEKILLEYNNLSGKNQEHFICRFYSREFPIAPPPFSMYEPTAFDYQADSIFMIIPDTSNRIIVELSKNGFYHIIADSSVKSGVTLFHFNENFPQVGTPEELIAPLRYLTTKKEFSELISSENNKDAVDKFWLGIGSNSDRAKELIRQYYNRVQDANRFFTSYVEGWKSDRGMIYIVFGAPNVIYKTGVSENWLYGEENNFMSINFNFMKVTNPFSDNDFILERSPIYKANYFKAVDTWREGRVFNTN